MIKSLKILLGFTIEAIFSVLPVCFFILLGFTAKKDFSLINLMREH